MYGYKYAEQKQPGVVKKGAAKQSRVKSIMWHLRRVARTRVDTSLWPSRLVRPRSDIKLRPSALVRTRTDIEWWLIGLVRPHLDISPCSYQCTWLQLNISS